MSDDLKLELARKIHGTPHATRTSFTATTWSGVERAWEWIGKNYHPQEPPMKQDHGCRGCNDPAYFHTPECIAKRPPPWTAEQREAAYSVAHNAIALSAQDALAMTDPGKDGDAFMRELARIAPLFVSPPPVPSVEECERVYDEAWNSYRGDAYRNRAGIAAVRALFVQGDGDGPHQGEGFARPTSQTLDTGARRAEAADESLVESARACEPLATPKKGREDARKPDSKTVDEGGSAPSPAPAPVSHPGKPDNCPAPAPDREAVAWGSMIIKARKELDRLCQDTRGWRMSIPADHTRDSDLIFDDALRCAENEIRTRDERIATITKERDEARNNRIAATAEWQRAVAAVIATLTRERDEARGKDVDVEACAREIAGAWGVESTGGVALREVLRKHFTGKARSVTREDAISLAVELMLPDKEIVDALRAIGFEVVG